MKGLVPRDQEPAGWESRSRSSLPSVPERRRANTAGQTSPSRTRPTCSSSRIPRSSASALCRWVVQGPDHRLSREDGERDVGPVCGHAVFEGVGRVGETAAAQKDGESRIVVGDGKAGEAQRSAQNKGDDQHECESGGRGPESAGGWGHRVAALPAGLENAHDSAATRRRFLSNRDGSRPPSQCRDFAAHRRSTSGVTVLVTFCIVAEAHSEAQNSAATAEGGRCSSGRRPAACIHQFPDSAVRVPP